MKFILAISILFFNLNYLSAQNNTKSKDPPPLSINISQKIIFAVKNEVHVHFLITIERHPKNRSFILSWDCPESGGSSFRSLEGEKAQRIFDSSNLVNSIYLTEGQCIISVNLRRNDGKNIIVSETVKVIDFDNYRDNF